MQSAETDVRSAAGLTFATLRRFLLLF